MIPYSSQVINKDDILAVKKVLKSKFITQGPLIELFEKKFKHRELSLKQWGIIPVMKYH